MIPGRKLYYRCPKCKQIAYRETLISGNTFGAKYYTDGKRDAPMLPSFPEVIKCECCDTIYWLNNKNRKWLCKQGTGGIRAYFLTADECKEAIDKKIYKNKSELKTLRINMWREFNDSVRDKIDGNRSWNNDDKKLYESNCLELIKLLDNEDVEDRIMAAELYRNLGNFEECKKMLETVDDKFKAVKERILKECEGKNQMTVKFWG